MAIRIIIADDHGVVAEGLKHLVEAQPDMEVIACVGDGREAVQQARDAQPDVVLMDLSMPELNGADATRAILERRPAADPREGMTAREREVLELMSTGLSNKVIALRLGITEATVKAHLTRIYRHLGVADRMQAALWAREHPDPRRWDDGVARPR